jgi:Fe-S-cluster-containing dehydrogenase component
LGTEISISKCYHCDLCVTPCADANSDDIYDHETVEYSDFLVWITSEKWNGKIHCEKPGYERVKM